MARTAEWPQELRGPRVFDAFGPEPSVGGPDQTAVVEAVRAALGR